MEELHAWEAFYVIVGAAVGALIGLQFVAITLVAQRPERLAADASAAFATPNVIHFCSTLLVAAIVAAPWEGITGPAVSWGVLGFCGVAYTAIVARRMRRQNHYVPELEDWMFHCVLPLAAYAGLALSSLVADAETRDALFVVGGAALLLLFCGIHNSWDAVVWQVFANAPRGEAVPCEETTPESD